MFWFGEVLVLLAGVLALSGVRRWLMRGVALRERHLDIAIGSLLVAGLLVSAFTHRREVERAGALDKNVRALREFPRIAQLEPTGVRGIAGAGLRETSEIFEALDGAWVEKDGKVFADCEEKSLQKFRAVTDQEPRFPFAYYALAVCLHEREESGWEEHAHKAIEIFEITTSLPDHRASHDQALAELVGMVSERRPE